MMTIFKNILLVSLILLSSTSQAKYALPTYEKIALENGLTLLLMEQHEVPLIDISIVTKAGAINDKEKAGLAYLTAESLLFGTHKLNKKAINEKMDFIGANLYSSTNVEFSTIGASFANKDINTVLPILRDVIVQPSFNKEEFDKFKVRHLLNLEQQKESPKSVINQYFNQMIFGPSGYGSVVKGNAKTIKNIKKTDIKNFHQLWYQPQNTAIVIVGDFKSDKMKSQINSLFKKWKNSAVIKPNAVPKNKALNQAKVLLVNKADAIQSTFVIGGQGISKSNPDLVGISVINTILGGRFTSWLNDELRVNSGLTYGARSRFASYSSSGSFSISTFTKTETTVDAIDLALKTYQRLWDKGIDQATLDSAKAYVKGQFPPKFETSSDLAGLLVNMYGYQFDEKYINTFEQQVNALTVEKTQKLIKQYFPKENLQFVVIGKADAIKDSMAKYGKVSEVNITDIGFNVL